MLECLEIAITAGDMVDRRMKKAMNTASWKLLDKPHKGLLRVALTKEEAPEAENAEGVPAAARSPARSRGGRGRGRGRGRSINAGADWLDSAEDLIASDASPAYRLAGLVIHKARLGKNWNANWDSVLGELRGECQKGIHPVWGKMGAEASILAEMALYPVAEVSEEAVVGDMSAWLAGARFDPLDRAAAADWFKMPAPMEIPTDADLATNRLATGLAGKRLPKMPAGLDELEGDVALIQALALTVLDAPGANDALAALTKGDIGSIAADHLALRRLRAGDEDAWTACDAAKGEDALSIAMRTVAWSVDPPADLELSAAAIQAGMDLVGAQAPDAIRWRLVEAMQREGDADAAASLAAELPLSGAGRIELILSLLSTEGGEVLADRLVDEMATMDDGPLNVITTSETDVGIRALAASLLLERDALDADGREVALDLFTQTGRPSEMGRLLMAMEDGATRYPHRTMLVHHLMPASASPELAEWMVGARATALAELGAEPSDVLSPISVALIKLLDGAPADLTAVYEPLTSDGVQAFRQCRRALMEGGDGLVSEEKLAVLAGSLESASLAGLERRLFHAVFAVLQYNRITKLLESGKEEDTAAAETALSSLIEEDARMTVVHEARNLVLEHGISVPALADWHRSHAPSSAWQRVVLAMMKWRQNELLSAARELRIASEHPTFDFETRVALARRALIGFALSGNWSEATDTLDAAPALLSALTARFQLYLRVCDDAARGQANNARDRLLDAVAIEETYTEENLEGEVIVKVRRLHSAEELDMLFSYPVHLNLPTEPWQGRVRAARGKLKSHRRSNSSQLENQFKNLMSDKAGTQEINSLADNAARHDAIQGLMMFERAMNSGNYSVHDMKRLRQQQQAMFSLHRDSIPVRRRRHLKHLTIVPLVLVDTNLLIDALKERIGRILNPEDDAPLGFDSGRDFHRTLLYNRTAGRVQLFVPSAALNEFKHNTEDPERVRQLFNDVWIDEVQWVETVTSERVAQLAEEVLADYSNWRPMRGTQFNESVQSYEELLVKFLAERESIYEKVADIKASHSEKFAEKRTEINGRLIYPERGDRDIMKTAAKLADDALRGIGSVLVATRDTDFTLVRRALEEDLGFGVICNARELTPFL